MRARRLLPTLLFAALVLQAAELPYYTFEGKKIPLQPSSRYVSLALKANASKLKQRLQSMSAEAMGPTRPNFQIVENTIQIEDAIRENAQQVEFQSSSFTIGELEVALQNEVIVRFKASVSAERINTILRAQKGSYVASPLVERKFVLTVPPKSSPLDVANNLAADTEHVQYAEPNFLVVLPASTMREPKSVTLPASPLPGPQDTLFPQQWALENEGSTGKTGAALHIQGAWSITMGSPNVTIAVLDDGVDTGHPDLADKIVNPFETVDRPQHPERASRLLDYQRHADPNPWDGHGTACAGIAAAVTRNGKGIAGVAANVKIMPIQVARSTKSGTWTATPDALAQGIRLAQEYGADVVSYSWVMPESSDVADAIRTSVIDGRNRKGTIFVFPAGNDASPVVSWPARLAGSLPVIAVSATNEWDEFKTKESSDGENWWGSNYGAEVVVSAPGVHIVTTDIHGSGGYVPDDYVANFNGTSAAVPHVSGIAALVISKFPELSAQQLRDRIASSADHLGAPGHDLKFGFGRVNACRALGGVDCGGPAPEPAEVLPHD